MIRQETEEKDRMVIWPLLPDEFTKLSFIYNNK